MTFTFIGVLLATLVITAGASPWVSMFVFVLVLGVIAAVNPRCCIFLTLAYLAFQGDLRRIVSLGMPAGSDPLVLVGAAIVLLLTFIALLQNRLTRQTPIARLVVILLVIMAIQSLNPQQGSLTVGLAGILCYIIPVCWFWVGQSWGSPRFTNALLYRAIVPIAVAAAIMGLVQVFGARPEYQVEWMRMRYAGRPLLTGDATRPFGFFTSVSEFTKYLGIGVVLLASSLIAGRMRLLALALPLLALAIFFASARGPVFSVCGVVIFLFALRSTSKQGWVARLIIGALCIIGGLGWTLTHVQEMEVAPELEFVVKHQTEGLLNPFDEEKSTATGHAWMAIDGLAEGLRSPLGRGLGMSTHLTGTFGAEVVGTEVDLANLMVSLGLIGGIVYAMLYYRVLRQAIILWRERRMPVVLALLAVLLMLIGNWLNTGDYSTIALAWFCIGALDAISSKTATTFHGSVAQ
jgi:hypothetical protein